MKERIVFLDWVRVIACFMVILTHATEPFYLGGEGTLILNETNALWSTVMNASVRACVPLFVIASSYLLFPVKGTTGEFFRRRFTRILIPFVLWTIILAFIAGAQNGNTTSLFKHLIFNFIGDSGHLWFMYMLVGVYLVMPILSPWADKVSKREEEGFLLLWLFTTTMPFIREVASRQIGSTELWGEASWNPYGMFYYVSGFFGYLMLGHYFKKYVPELSWRRTLIIAIPLWIVGFTITAGSFWMLMPHNYPVNGPIDIAVLMETGWEYNAFGVALTVIGWFLVLRKITYSGAFFHRIIVPLSKASYGTYIIHLVILGYFHGLYNVMMPTGCCIFATAISTFVTASLLSIILGKIPVIGKYIVG